MRHVARARREIDSRRVAVLGHTTWHPYMRTTPFLRHINENGPQFGYSHIPDPNDANRTLGNNAFTTGLFAGYSKSDRYSVGFEGFRQRTANGTKVGSLAPFGVEDKTAAGYSTWSWYGFTSKIGVVGRWDYFDPDTNSAVKGDARNLFIGALYIKPVKNVFIMPNVEAESYQKRPGLPSFTTSVTPRITFYWVFL